LNAVFENFTNPRTQFMVRESQMHFGKNIARLSFQNCPGLRW